jgi:mannitol/fructose-specific phosphotransferase system IIA component (Ntr-type)
MRNPPAANSLSHLLHPEDIILGLHAANLREAVSRLLSGPLASRDLDVQQIAAAIDAVMEREQIGSTCMPPLVLPHARINGIARIICGFGINPAGVIAGQPEITIALAFVSPADAPADHLRFLSSVAQIFRSRRAVEQLLAAPDTQTILSILRANGC